MLLSSNIFLAQNTDFNFINNKQPRNQFLFGNLLLQSKLRNGYESNLKPKSKKVVSSYGGAIPSILKSLDTIKDISEALKPWERTLSKKERSIILKEQSSWKRAVEIFDWFKEKGCYELNVIHYNIMLRVLGKASRWDLINSLWLEMKSNEIIPTNSTYGTLIDVYSKGGMNKVSLIWLGEMCKQGIEPDEVTMGIVIQTYRKAKEFQKAEEFFKKWSSVDVDNDALEHHKSYSLYTYNMLIDTYGKAGELKKASDTFACMLREGIAPDIVTFNTMIHICGNHGCLEEIGSLLAIMEETRCLPDTRTYNILISICIKSDDIDAAANCFVKMKVNGLAPDNVSYRTLLYAFSIRDMVKEVEILVNEMGGGGLEIDEYTHSALTRMYVRVKLLDKSWSWFERFCHKMSSECFSANIDAFGEKGLINIVEKAFRCCVYKQKLSVLVFNVMIKAYGKCGELDKVCDLFDDMKGYNILPDQCTYSSIIQILSTADLPHQASCYLEKMQYAGVVSDCIPYSMVISSFLKIGEFENAEDIFKSMFEFGIKPDLVVYSVLINGFTDIGNIKEAMKYVKLMKNNGLEPNSILCNSLIKLYTKVGYVQESQETYRLLKALGDKPDIYSSNCMIDLYCENSMVKEAEEVFLSLKKRGEANEFSHAMMLCLYKKLGQFDKAYEIAKEMKTQGLLNETLSYNSVIGLYASHGRMREAVMNFQQMVASGVQPNDATFKLLGAVLIKRGASKEAVKHLECVRRNDSRSGLHEWVKALCSLVSLDYTFKLPVLGAVN